ncbi:helix-turn-helix domain-containing protein [Microbacterium sp. AGC62]
MTDEIEDARARVQTAWTDLEGAVAGRIKSIREKRGLSQAQLSELVKSRGYNLHQTAIAKIEAGKRPLRVGELFALSDCLGFTPLGLYYLPEDAIADADLKALDAQLKDAVLTASTSEQMLSEQIRDLATLHAGNEARRQLLALRMRNAVADARRSSDEDGVSPDPGSEIPVRAEMAPGKRQAKAKQT